MCIYQVLTSNSNFKTKSSLKSQLNLLSTNAEEVEALRRNNDELKKRLEHLERYSRDFNIRALGVNEDEGEECMTIITDFITSLGFEAATAEIENAHRTGKNETISQDLSS